jgi:hypothetical protein
VSSTLFGIALAGFMSNSHARSFSYKDSSPKISFGKMTVKGKKRTMPVSYPRTPRADGWLSYGAICGAFSSINEPIRLKLVVLHI